MPVRVRPKRAGEKGKPFKLVDSETGKVEAESDTREKADAAARAHNAAHRRKLNRSADVQLVMEKALPEFIQRKVDERKKKSAAAEEEGEGKGKKKALKKKREYKSNPALVISELAKFAIEVSRDGGHTHRLELPEEPQAGTFVTRAARSPGAPKAHVHVFTVRPGSKPGRKVVSSPGVDGHTHTMVLGRGRQLAKAVDISGEGPAKVTGADSTRRESLDGTKRNRRRKGRRKNDKRGRDFLRAALADGLDQLSKATKREGGQDFGPGAFAYVPDRNKPSTWKLRLVEKPGGPPTRAQVGRAVAALGPGGFRGQRVQIPRADLGGVKRKVAAAFRRVNPGRDLPRALQA